MLSCDGRSVSGAGHDRLVLHVRIGPPPLRPGGALDPYAFGLEEVAVAPLLGASVDVLRDDAGCMSQPSDTCEAMPGVVQNPQQSHQLFLR